MTEFEVRQALRKAGFSGQSLETILAIAKAESGLNPKAIYSTGREYSVGLFQINLKAHPYISESCASDPICSAKAVYTISGGGKNFKPWTTYTTGKYKAFMNKSTILTFPVGTTGSPTVPLQLNQTSKNMIIIIGAILLIIAISYIKKG